MEFDKLEILNVQQANDNSAVESLCELSEFELAIVGGGGGDVVFA